MDDAPKVERRKRKPSDYAWIATIIAALGTSIAGIITAMQGHSESDKVAKSAYVATTTQLALIEYRLGQLEERMKRREERVIVGNAGSGYGTGVGRGVQPAPAPTVPASMPVPPAPHLPSFEELQQHVKKTGEAFSKELAK